MVNLIQGGLTPTVYQKKIHLWKFGTKNANWDTYENYS